MGSLVVVRAVRKGPSPWRMSAAPGRERQRKVSKVSSKIGREVRHAYLVSSVQKEFHHSGGEARRDERWFEESRVTDREVLLHFLNRNEDRSDIQMTPTERANRIQTRADKDQVVPIDKGLRCRNRLGWLVRLRRHMQDWTTHQRC